MSQNRFHEAKRIFNSALEREPDGRQAYLDEACAGNASLRKEVESLLACQPDAKEFFISPAIKTGAQPIADKWQMDLTGRTLLHYSIAEKIGEGGMGVVYKARDLHLDRSVAIKILPAHAMADPERKRRFVQEAKAASALNHPNVIQIFDINSDAGVDFIAMEYVSGKTLDQRIGKKGLPVNEVLKYGVQVADALAAAHAAGIIHRDLKPANVMVTAKGQVKVLDFGLAKLTQPTSDDLSSDVSAVKTLTEEGRIVGTIAYMSPEQAEGKAVDARSDIFSLGSVLYEMATGRRAFQGDSNLSTLSAILKQEPAPCGAGIPHGLGRIILRCLRKDPARRFQHTGDIKVELEELREQTDSGLQEAVPIVTPLWRRKSVLWSLLFLFIVISASISFYFLPRDSSEAPAMKVVPLTSYMGSAILPTFSPDGNQVAFSWNGEAQDNYDIYVKVVGSTAPPLRLTFNPARDLYAAWSPDGSQIEFVRETDQSKQLYLISPLGGPERKLTDLSIRSSGAYPYTISWSPDGKQLNTGPAAT